MSKKLVACDTETDGFRYYQGNKIVGMSFGWQKEHFYVPVRHSDSRLGGTQPSQLDMNMIRPQLQEFFSQNDVFIILHNAKFDMHFYKADDIEIKTPFHDTTFLWHLYDENAPAALKVISSGWTDDMKHRHKGLFGPEAAANEKKLGAWRIAEAKARREYFKSLVMSRADELQTSLEHQDKKRSVLKNWIIANELAGHIDNKVGKEDIHYGYVPIEMMTEYAAIDTFLTYALYEHVMDKLDMNSDIAKVYLNELKLCKALLEIEEHGALIDVPYLKVLENELAQECKETENRIYKFFGKQFNLGSTTQLAEALIEKGVPLTKTTASGRFATDKKVLKSLAKDHAGVKDILTLRESQKIMNTYAIGIQDLVENDYIHMSFNQNVSTGRMSCRDPNVQNIPRNDTRIRKAFICPDNHYFVFADYSQVEVRLTAHFSEDPIMLDAYSKGQDIHSRTACEMFAIPYDELIKVLGNDEHEMYKKYKELRSVAKCVHPSTIINTSNGLRRLDQLLSFPEEKDSFGSVSSPQQVLDENNQFVDITQTYNGGTKDLLHVVTNRGTLTCSKNHKFVLSDTRQVRAEELKVTTELPNPEFYSPEVENAPKTVGVIYRPYKDAPECEYNATGQMAYIAGAFMGDGSVCGAHTVCITHGDIKKQGTISISFQEWQRILFNEIQKADLRPVCRDKSIYLGSRSVLRFFEALKLVDTTRELKSSSQKSFRIPSWVLSGGKEFISEFIAGLIDTDGTVSKEGILSFTTCSAVLAGHMCSCLSYLGLKFTQELSYNKEYDKNYYRIRLLKADGGYFRRYLRHTGKRNRLPEHKYGVSKFRKPCRVLAILPAGNLPCVDIEVNSDSHLYRANGFITHNTINFGIIYGVGALGLSTQIDRPDRYKDAPDSEWIAACQEFIDQYFRKYRGVKRFVNKCSRIARNKAEIPNHFGRIRHLPHINAYKILGKEYGWMSGRAERQAGNFVVQSTAADIFKFATVRVHEEVFKNTNSMIVNLVHDEIQSYIHKDELDLLNKKRDVMEDFDFLVPLKVEFAYSTTSWAAKKGLAA